MPSADTVNIEKIRRRTDKVMGRKTPKKLHTTTGIIMDTRDLTTLRKCSQLRVIRGEVDRASVSDLVREAVTEYITKHGLAAQESLFDQMAEGVAGSAI